MPNTKRKKEKNIDPPEGVQGNFWMPPEMKEDFLKVCKHNEHDFAKRLRYLIAQDIRQDKINRPEYWANKTK